MGEGFSKSIAIQSIQTLAEVCLPEYQFSSNGDRIVTRNYDSQISKEINYRTDRLVAIAHGRVDNLVKWFDKAESVIAAKGPNREEKIRKVGLLKSELSSYHALTTTHEQLSFLRCNRLGFYAFTNACLLDPFDKGFIEELEIDVLGRTTLSNHRINNHVGEIKSGRDFKTAILQLIKRLGILYLAGLHSLPPNITNDYTFESIGEIFRPIECDPPDEELIRRCKEEIGLTHYPFMTFLVTQI